jgi:hypothetical protein
MKKLELKHLAPYLPYDLKAYCFKSELLMTIEDEMTSDTISLTDLIETQHKPILRPLSQLTQDKITCDEINLFLEPNGLEINNFFLLKNSLNSVAISWEEMQEVLNILYREHYDVHNLIYHNLAIEKS